VTAVTSTLEVSYNPYDYAIHDDPYPTYARLRAQAPLYRNDELDFWAVSRHADVAAAFRDHERFSNGNGVSLDPSAWGQAAHRTMSFLAMDPPTHTRMRSLVSKGFTPRRVRELEGTVLRLTRRYLDPALAKGEFEVIADFAGRLPMDVISDMMGVPETDRDEVRRLADPACVAAWREETLRYDTSSQMIARTVARDTELYGRVVPAGARMLLLVGSANRDPSVFADPDTYDLDRDTSALISFGGGRHFCLGANLARLEAQVALTEFVRRVRAYEIDAPNAVRVHSINVRGFAALPIAVALR
jgi:cytochrome P450